MKTLQKMPRTTITFEVKISIVKKSKKIRVVKQRVKIAVK
jgi:hypothetical protein